MSVIIIVMMKILTTLMVISIMLFDFIQPIIKFNVCSLPSYTLQMSVPSYY